MGIGIAIDRHTHTHAREESRDERREREREDLLFTAAHMFAVSIEAAVALARALSVRLIADRVRGPRAVAPDHRALLVEGGTLALVAEAGAVQADVAILAVRIQRALQFGDELINWKN